MRERSQVRNSKQELGLERDEGGEKDDEPLTYKGEAKGRIDLQKDQDGLVQRDSRRRNE